jgi:hypothetical protein
VPDRFEHGQETRLEGSVRIGNAPALLRIEKLNVTALIPRVASPVANLTMKSLF